MDPQLRKFMNLLSFDTSTNVRLHKVKFQNYISTQTNFVNMAL